MSDKQYFLSVERLKILRQNILSSVARMQNTADRKNLPEAIFLEHIRPIFEGYQPVISSLASNHGDTLYRARKCKDEEPFESIRDLYHPPTSSGRALTSDNLPILYASSSLQTCLSEIDPKIGELINVVQLKYTKIMNGQFWFVGERGSINKSNEPSQYLGDLSSAKRHVHFPHIAQHSWIFADSLMNEIFSKLSSKLDNYALNQFLIEEIERKISNPDALNGVIFLSTKDSPGRNFAIFGDAISELEPATVNLVRITDIDEYGYVEFNLLGNSKSRNGTLEWSQYILDSV